MPLFGNLFKDEPLPENGFIDLPADKPGFGVTLNREELDLRRTILLNKPLDFRQEIRTLERNNVDPRPIQDNG
eukprot:TRINITY_DN9835_c0_g1_i1.p1 TRINITY_DN9835_c0_g1~~TRINITY_DN9835_c0_g1_i1.p1  ORF type:complete len:73 (-),score=9.51 TRINITY_DN9835_c0_g1_i1:20-238(-)